MGLLSVVYSKGEVHYVWEERVDSTPGRERRVKAIEFYTAALGAEEIMRMPTPDGRLMHASLKIGRRGPDAVRRLPRILRGRVAGAERAVAGHAAPER